MMKKDTLYLHVGWSKTGTSAIQSQIQQQHADFLEKGILYPQSLQWPDHSHHPFALSFKGSGAYQSDMSPAEALETLRLEMEASASPNVLMSSELSPFYFNNPRFKSFVGDHFQNVEVIFTVRPQSDLLLSLFNQLVKDPNVRYTASIFTLCMRNLSWLNYFQNIKRWTEVLGQNSIHVIPYSKAVVSSFFDIFGVEKREFRNGSGTEIVNPSFPTRCLALLQEKGKKASSNQEFIAIKDNIIKKSQAIDSSLDTYTLFSVDEQKAVSDNFLAGNKKLIETYCLKKQDLIKSEFSSGNAIPPDMFIDL